MVISRPRTCSHFPNMVLLEPPVRYFDGQFCFYRFLVSMGKNWEKIKKSIFRQFLLFDKAISRPKTWSYWPKMVLLVFLVRYFDGQVHFYWFLGPLNTKNWKKLRKKSKKMDFSGIHGHSEVQKIWFKSSILVLFGSLVGHWDMQSCFRMFVCVFQAIRGVKNDLNQNMSFLLWYL